MIYFSEQKVGFKRLTVLMVHRYCYIRKALKYVTPRLHTVLRAPIKDLSRPYTRSSILSQVLRAFLRISDLSCLPDLGGR